MRTREISLAAFALTRFRFVRALLASAMVNAPLVCLFLGVSVAYGEPGTAMRVAAGVFVLVLFMALLIAMSIALNVIDRIHRRVVAFLSLYVVLLLPLALLVSATFWAGQWRQTAHLGDTTLLLMDAVTLVMALVSLLLFVECALFAVWAIFASKAAYLSVRGWRPPWSNFVTNFTHQLGFPPYAAQIRTGQLGLGFLYFLIAILNVVFFGGLTEVLWLPHAGSAAKTDMFTIGLLAVPVVAAVLLLAGVGRLLGAWSRRRATKLYQQVRQWDNRRPILFLRSFNQDKTAVSFRTRDPVLQWPPGLGRKQELDELLLETGAPFGPVIAIGDPRNPIPPLGAARVFVKNAEEDWKSVVGDLLTASCAVVICPHISPGVAWEIEQVTQPAILPRTIVLASPELSAQDNTTLFARVTGVACQVKRGRQAVAAFQHPKDGWTLLVARKLTAQTYTVGLNWALHGLFGETSRAAAQSENNR